MSLPFNPDLDIQTQTGKVFLVTGGNVGLGRESVYQLAKHKPKHIILAARDAEKAKTAIEGIKKDVPTANITFLHLDLASFESIKTAADTFNKQFDRLDVLINNAGIMACPPGVTEEGYEIQFGTNHLGHALLTKLLLPKLHATSQKPNADVRIINVSSAAHTWAPKKGLVLDETKSPMKSYSTWERYGQSKLANIHYNRELARRNPNLRCVALHPGSVRTNLISGPQASYPMIGAVIPWFARLSQVSVQEGALTQLWASTSKSAKTGMLYYPVAQEERGSTQAQDEGLTKRLWDWTEKEFASYGF